MPRKTPRSPRYRSRSRSRTPRRQAGALKKLTPKRHRVTPRQRAKSPRKRVANTHVLVMDLTGDAPCTALSKDHRDTHDCDADMRVCGRDDCTQFNSSDGRAYGYSDPVFNGGECIKRRDIRKVGSQCHGRSALSSWFKAQKQMPISQNGHTHGPPVVLRTPVDNTPITEAELDAQGIVHQLTDVDIFNAALENPHIVAAINAETQRRPGVHIERPTLQVQGRLSDNLPLDGQPNDMLPRSGGGCWEEGIGNAHMMKSNTMFWMTDVAPHEALPLTAPAFDLTATHVYRQFFRLVTQAGDKMDTSTCGIRSSSCDNTSLLPVCKGYEMSASVLQKQMTCVRNGDVNGVTVFLPPPMPGVQLINFALYPGPRAVTETARTETEMYKLLDAGTNMVWVDLCVLSANVRNSIIDQQAIASLVLDDEVINDFFHRFALQLAVAGGTPCVFVAGKTCQTAFQRMLELGLISHIEELSTLGVTLCEAGGRQFMALEGRPHPSHHLVKGREANATNIFKETLTMINGITRCCASGEFSSARINQSLLASMDIDEEEIAARDERRKFLTQLLYGSDSGHFPVRDMHLRNVKAHIPEVRNALLKWAGRGVNILLCILRSGALYLDLPAYDARLEYWYDELGTSFTAFMCNSVAARLTDNTFHNVLISLRTQLGEQFKTLMCNGVAARLDDDKFMMRLRYWYDELGFGFRTFMSGSVAARLTDDDFHSVLISLRAQLGDHFKTLMCDGVASRLGDDKFMLRLRYWCSELGNGITAFMCGSVAARLTDDHFHDVMISLRAQLGDQFKTFMCGGVASRLGDNKFMLRLRYWCSYLGTGITAFMSNSVAARLTDDTFHEMLLRLQANVGNEKMATLMCNSFVVRLGVVKFDQRFGFWMRKLGDRITVFLGDSAAARLTEDSFHLYMVDLYERLGRASFCKFICNGVACRVAKLNGFDKWLEVWFTRLGDDAMSTFMCDSVAARFKSKNFNDIALRLLGVLGKHNFARVFEISGFANRIEGAEAEKRIILLHQRLGGDALYTYLRKNRGKKFDAILK
ncbi:hypothetical protein JKP88DRAFT_243968 [Tribonema minus]|uniref:Uncharacterized protein n=1 Tax=Tribonema minus TaxID=303371 RepID=A0A836CI62_9STRA|nr:hypothetical protein JKP88DRAFT_243968 [Tribonema minus]